MAQDWADYLDRRATVQVNGISVKHIDLDLIRNPIQTITEYFVASCQT
jgi:hypothetical protein